ncbi:MAG: single-stranded DNA-binding protein [Bacillota bacterium]
MNIIILKGNLTRDPQVKTLNSGKKVTEFSIAINESYKNAAGEKVEKVFFIECQSWGNQGEIISKHLTKGDPILINGKLSIDTWEAKDTGTKLSKTRVVIEQFEFCGGKRHSASNSSSENKVAHIAPMNEIEEIPF